MLFRSCPECSAWRVLHRVSAGGPKAARYQLVCHHCGGGSPVPRACPECGNLALAGLGRGTQRLEEELAAQFPGRRIARLDRDVASRRGAAQALIAAVHDGEVDLLVGTQMLAKGMDLPSVTLAAVLAADGLLHRPDLRAGEHCLQLLFQLAGRAGRGERPGEVLVQTYTPDHPVIRHLVDGRYGQFLVEEEIGRAHV